MQSLLLGVALSSSSSESLMFKVCSEKKADEVFSCRTLDNSEIKAVDGALSGVVHVFLDDFLPIDL